MDKRNELLNEITMVLTNDFPEIDFRHAVDKIAGKLMRYVIEEECTDVAVRDNDDLMLLKRWAACLKLDGRSAGTVKAYVYQVKKFIEDIPVPVTEVKTNHIRAYLAKEKDRGLSDAYMENIRSYVSTFYRWLLSEDIIEKDPCAKIKPFKIHQLEEKPFTSAQIDSIRTACSCIKHRAIMEALIATGARVSEITDLNIDDLDFNQMTVHIRHGKGDKERYAYISPVASKYIKAYLSTRKDDDPALFVGNSGGRITPGGIRPICSVLSKRTGIDRIHPHRFRHSLASDLAARGMAIPEVQRILGHSGMDMTMRYVHLNDELIKYSYQRFA